MIIDFNEEQMADIKKMLSSIENGAAWAMQNSINAAISTTKSQAVKKTAGIINLPQKTIRGDFSEEKASKTKLSGKIHVEGKPHGLMAFGAKKSGKFGGVKVKVLKSGGEKTIKSAFIANAKGSTHVFQRKPVTNRGKTGYQSPKRIAYFASIRKGGKNSFMKYPAKRLSGVDIYSQVRKVEGELQTIAADRLQEKLNAEIDRLVTKYG